MIEYLLEGDFESLRCAIIRSKRLPDRRWRHLYLPRVLSVAGYGFGFYCAAIGAGLIGDFPGTGLILFLPLGLMLLIDLASNWFLRRAYAQWPRAGRQSSIVLDETGLSISEDGDARHVAWGAIEALFRFPDGFLSQTRNGRFGWWPDRALSSGTVSEVIELLKKHVNRYEEVN